MFPAALDRFSEWNLKSNSHNLRSEDTYIVQKAVSVRNEFAGTEIPQNPHLGLNNFGSPHCDSYCSESVGLKGPVSEKLRVIRQRNEYGFMPCMVCNSHNQMISVSLDIKGLHYWLVVFDKECNLLSSTKLSLKTGLTFGGGYFYMNHKDQTVVVSENKMICFDTAHVTADSGAGPTNELDSLWQTDNIVKLITGSAFDNTVYSSMPVWGEDEDLYWVLLAGKFDPTTAGNNQPAGMAVVRVTPDPGKGNGCVTSIVDKMLLPNEWNNNTFSVDETGAYFVTNGIDSMNMSTKGWLRHVRLQRNSIVDKWSTPYKNCGYRKAGLTNIGSGTTPTLINTKENGQKLVAIGDNSEPRMNVLVCDRETGDVFSETPVFSSFRSGDEASLIGVQNTLIVENNYGHLATVPMSQYVPIEPGMTRINVDGKNKTSTEVWTNDRTSFLAMNMLARESGIIFAHTADWSGPESATRGAMYYVTAMDSYTGRHIWRVPLGRGAAYCHDYGGLYFNSEGSLYIGTENYLISVQDCE